MSTHSSPTHAPSQSPSHNPSHTPTLHTYHCLCATLLLCTPYSISSLPTRAPPSRDKARILPLPPIHTQHHHRRRRLRRRRLLSSSAAPSQPVSKTGNAGPAADAVEDEDEDDENEEGEEEDGDGDEDEDDDDEGIYIPSLILPALRPARKIIIVKREDGWERRRVWRCGRCGLGVGYEVEEEEGGGGGGGGGRKKGPKGPEEEREGKKLRVMFLLEGGLVETGAWDEKDGGLQGGS